MSGTLNLISRRKPKVGKVMGIAAVAFSLVIALFILPRTAWAGEVFHFMGQSADAFFSSVSPPACDCNVAAGPGKPVTPACIFTEVSVFATEQKFQSPPGPGGSSSSAGMFILEYDCTFTTLLIADCFFDVSLADQEFLVGQNLESATLRTKLSCFDYVSSSSFNVNVDLAWTGTGDLSRNNSHFHNSFPGCTFNSQSNGTFRPAEASGTVLSDSMNFTPDTALYADISSSKYGDVVAACNFQ